MNILVCFDHYYVPPTGIMLKSLFINNPTIFFNVHAIISPNVDDSDLHLIRELVENSKAGTISLYRFRHDLLDDYPGLRGTHLKESNYYRLFCASLLPANIDTVLYLDSDIIVNGVIDKLCHEDLYGVPIAAVINPGLNGVVDNYFNSGVLLINLIYWRSHNAEALFVDYIHRNAELIKWADQDVLNGVFALSKRLLPLCYNLQEGFLLKKTYLTRSVGSQIGELDDAFLDPVIIHFSGSLKPWMVGCHNPYRPLFKKYKKLTPWKDSKISNESYIRLCKRLIRRCTKYLLIRLGLLKDLENHTLYQQIYSHFSKAS